MYMIKMDTVTQISKIIHTPYYLKIHHLLLYTSVGNELAPNMLQVHIPSKQLTF